MTTQNPTRPQQDFPQQSRAERNTHARRVVYGIAALLLVTTLLSVILGLNT